MKVVTVGAGPCGLYASRLLSDMGHEVTLLEEHSTVGEPVQCAGLVGKKLIDIIGDEHVINKIDGANIHLGDRHFTLERKDVAYVLDRCSFDRSLGEGLDIFYNSRVLGVDAHGNEYTIRSASVDHSADIVIGADGPNSIVGRDLRFNSDIRLYPAYQERVRFSPEDEGMVTIDVVRPFFSWIIPEGNGIVRLGTVGDRENISRMKRRFGVQGETISTIKAPIPIGRSDLCKGNAFLVGDAAAQTKPLTGGGLYYGIRGASMLAEAIGNGEPHTYEKLWCDKFGKEIGTSMRARKIYEAMSQSDLEKAFEILSQKKCMIERDANFERHSSALRVLLTSPGLISILGKNITSLF